MSNSCRKTSN